MIAIFIAVPFVPPDAAACFPAVKLGLADHQQNGEFKV
jgi:hypothetical protein